MKKIILLAIVTFILPTSVAFADTLPTFSLDASTGSTPSVGYTSSPGVLNINLFDPSGNIVTTSANGPACGPAPVASPVIGYPAADGQTSGTIYLLNVITFATCTVASVNPSTDYGVYTVMVVAQDTADYGTGTYYGNSEPDTLSDEEANVTVLGLTYALYTYDYHAGSPPPSHSGTGMFSATSTVSVLKLASSDTGSMIIYIVAILLAGLIALLGLGFGIRKLKQYITGQQEWGGSLPRYKGGDGRNRSGGMNMLE